ncbi:MAG: hypothetical protein JST80_11370 [Bdellovibrionales bacterium]|nr:hypothetical protein [Bdellovibrionales bacterium]
MKLTIVILGILGMLAGMETQAVTPAKKPASKAPARVVGKRTAHKPVAKTTTRPVARTASRTPVRTASRPVAKIATRTAHPTAKTSAHPAAKTAARVPASNGMSYHSTSNTAPAADAPKQASFNDQAKIADSLKAMSAPRMATGGMPSGGGAVHGGGTHEIGEALRVTGQSRNLSMGLLFSKDNDKIEFGNPRMHYKDKISSKQANY